MWAVAAATQKASEPEETSAASAGPDLRPPRPPNSSDREQLSSDVEQAVQPSPTQIPEHLLSCQPAWPVSFHSGREFRKHLFIICSVSTATAVLSDDCN